MMFLLDGSTGQVKVKLNLGSSKAKSYKSTCASECVCVYYNYNIPWNISTYHP